MTCVRAPTPSVASARSSALLAASSPSSLATRTGPAPNAPSADAKASADAFQPRGGEAAPRQPTRKVPRSTPRDAPSQSCCCSKPLAPSTAVSTRTAGADPVRVPPSPPSENSKGYWEALVLTLREGTSPSQRPAPPLPEKFTV